MTATRSKPSKLLPVEPSPTARARVFLLPYSGCGPSVYRQWPAERNGVEYCRLQPPGRERRMAEPTFRTYTELAEEICAELAPYLDRPYALFGHCGSALAAYEAAVRLQAHGLPTPAQLFVSSQVAPQDGPTGRYLTMTGPELKEELAQLTIAMGGKPVPALLDLQVEVLRADLDANRRYIVANPVRLDAPITAIGWAEAHELPPSAMTGWHRCGRTTDVVLSGGHHRFLEGTTDLLDVLDTGLESGRA